MRCFAAACLTAMLLSQAALAQVSTRNPADVQAGAYTADSSHTRIVFSVSHMGFSTWYGNLTGATGSLMLDPHNPAASHVDISIPAGSISTTNAVLDGKLKSSAWFDVGSYPVITFKSTSIQPTGPDNADITGNLTLRGFTHPVVLHTHFNGAGTNPLDRAYTVGFDATLQLKRSEFGINTFVPLIGDDVNVAVSAPFEKK
jgi:polyisoprenoid-binding protein YceI